jgi:hypothetical protein
MEAVRAEIAIIGLSWTCLFGIAIARESRQGKPHDIEKLAPELGPEEHSSSRQCNSSG